MAASNDPFGDLSDSVELSEANVAAFLFSPNLNEFFFLSCKKYKTASRKQN